MVQRYGLVLAPSSTAALPSCPGCSEPCAAVRRAGNPAALRLPVHFGRPREDELVELEAVVSLRHVLLDGFDERFVAVGLDHALTAGFEAYELLALAGGHPVVTRR